MKKILCVILAALLTTVALTVRPVFAVGNAVCVTEALTGETIYEENADERLFPAALVKLMSYLIIFEAMESGRVSAGDTVTVSSHAAKKGGSSVFLDEGSGYALGELLRAAIVSSGNDAVTAIAEHIAGSEEAFTEQMNARARELGLSAEFYDCSGLQPETRVSARELARIAAELAEYPSFFADSTVWTYTFTHTSGRQTELTNANKLIKNELYDGMATGSSNAAGYCLAASQKSGSARFICVILGAESSEKRFIKAQEQLKQASGAYGVYEAARAGARIKSAEISGAKEKTVDLYAADDLALLIPKASEQDIQKSLTVNELTAPMNKGDAAGMLTVKLPDGTERSVELTVGEDVEEYGLISGIRRITGLWLFRR